MHLFSSRYARLTGVAMLVFSLAACGGGNKNDGDGDNNPVQPADPTSQGTLKAATLLNTIAQADISAAMAEESAAIKALQPRYAVTSYRLEYLTVDAKGQSVRASGLVSVPVKAAGAKSPVLSYQHGTIFKDAEAPSNNAVASEVSVVMASLGYIVLAPDYVGFGASKGVPHPYLQSAPMAASVIDFLTAAKTWRGEAGVQDNQQLFLTGYSEGGYATMAAHRALQAKPSVHLPQLRAVVPGAGPYNVQVTLDSLIDLVSQKHFAGKLIDPKVLRYLGTAVQNEVRRALLRELIPNDADTQIDSLFLDNFLSYDLPETERVSNVHNWRPQAPVYLYHGRDDRTVPYASATSTLAAMQAQGAGELVTLTDCSAAESSHLNCVAPFMDFMLGKLASVAQDL